MDLKPEKVIVIRGRLQDDRDHDHRSESETTTTTTTKSSPVGSVLGSSSKQVKSCSDCQTTRTPLWRGGPAGPKSLCNACGIKYNKKRREMLGLDKNRTENKGKKKRKISGGGGGIGQSLKMKLMGLGGEMMVNERLGKLLSTLREEEQAAVLLMALSCGSVYA